MVTMRGKRIVFHYGCIYSREKPGCIWYSQEPYALTLRGESLHLCAGDGPYYEDYEGMEDLRGLVRMILSRRSKSVWDVRRVVGFATIGRLLFE